MPSGILLTASRCAGTPIEGYERMSSDQKAFASEPLMFFNDNEARTVDALAGRIFPGDAADPGAHEAGVVTYIDRTLAGFQSELQGFYQQGLTQLDRYSKAKHGAAFADLPEATQDQVITAIDSGVLLIWAPKDPSADREPQDAATGQVTDLLSAFFALVREHTIQGMFCDPAYGGNRGEVGWRLVGFPGAQWEYSAEQMRPGFDATTIPLLTLAELRRQRGPSGSGGRTGG